MIKSFKVSKVLKVTAPAPAPAPAIDSRLKALSASSCVSLHTCPRKYQLNKVGKESRRDSTVTLSYGTSFGAAIQKLLITGSLQAAKLEAFLTWDRDIEDADKSNKSLWELFAALEGFESFAEDNDIGEYEVAIFNGVPAAEFSFAISLGGGFYYRGFVDLILQHKETGTYTILEIKHTGMNYVLESSYANQGQALSYSVVLDYLTGEQSDYKLIYLVYLTGVARYEEFIFAKSATQRAKFIRNTLIDKKLITLYAELGDFPQHGESCTAWGRPCLQFETCGMSDERLVSSLVSTPVLEIDKEDRDITYDIVVNIEDIINNQIKRIGA